jgi:hypothetical protein
MKTEPVKLECDVCHRDYRHGPHIYEGHRLSLYGEAFACNPCWIANHDGWAPHYERRLLALLKERDLATPSRLANGLLPRG